MEVTVKVRGYCLPGILALAPFCTPAAAQDAVQGAMLYMRLANDTRACVSCHGPDPGVNPNNILRAADSPNTLVKVMSTVSAMGFLSSQLNVKEPTLQACMTLTPAGPIATRSLNSSASQAGVGTKPCLTNIFIQRGALRATISAS